MFHTDWCILNSHWVMYALKKNPTQLSYENFVFEFPLWIANELILSSYVDIVEVNEFDLHLWYQAIVGKLHRAALAAPLKCLNNN